MKNKNIGLRVQDVEVGKRVYYYSFVSELENSEPQPAVITSRAYEICGTLCCKIDIRTSVVALDNLSEEPFPKCTMSAKKRRSKERYQKFLNTEGAYTDDFGEYIKRGWYKDMYDD